MSFLKTFKAFFGFNPEWFTFYAGGGGSQPTSTTQTTTTIPAYAKPYVERMLGKAEALTESPYQAYGGQRAAGFNPLQQQAFQGAGQLGTAEQVGQGSQLAGVAGLQGLTAGGRYMNMATSPQATQAFMSPYIQGALDPQLREARRQSDITGQQNQAQAVQQGAFGGSRSAIVEAERQRNLGNLQSDIYGKGMQSAFEAARQAQQFGSTLGLQGAQQAAAAAGTLGQLGQTQFAQEQGAIDTQAKAGATQQAREQQMLDQAYQDFLSQRGYQQQQLSFMSDILRGTPLSQTSYQMYQAPPSMLSQIGGLGLAGYGMFGGQNPIFKAEGGMIDVDEEKAPAGLAELAVHNVMKGQK